MVVWWGLFASFVLWYCKTSLTFLRELLSRVFWHSGPHIGIFIILNIHSCYISKIYSRQPLAMAVLDNEIFLFTANWSLVHKFSNCLHVVRKAAHIKWSAPWVFMVTNNSTIVVLFIYVINSLEHGSAWHDLVFFPSMDRVEPTWPCNIVLSLHIL